MTIFDIEPPTVLNPDLTPLLSVEGPIEVYDTIEVNREDIVDFLEKLPNEVIYHTADLNLKSAKIKIIYEPYCFLTKISLRSRDIYYKQEVPPLKWNFISLCSAPKSFRYDILDSFYKHNYFVYSNYPYSKVNETDYKVHPTNDKLIEYKGANGFNNYHFKTLTEIETDHRGYQELVPVEYLQSNIDLVLESDVDNLFITEKTWKPIVYKKPFIIVGSKGIHSKLEELGFKLHTELFDFSFDLEYNRHDMIVDQVKRYIDIHPTKLKEMINFDIVEYNFNRYCEVFDVESRKRV